MMRLLGVLFMSAIIFTVACSKETVKRTGYETLQNIREQECYKTPSIDCEQRERIEVYEDRKQEVDQTD